jgi:hypothetical protein
MNRAEQCWLQICGTESTAAVTVCYWELFVDLTLVAAAGATAQILRTPQDGFLEFALIYLSIINGWFLYIHHYASRFQTEENESSKIHWVLFWVYLTGMIAGVGYASFETYQQFSMAMIVQRFAVVLILAHVACHVDRVVPLCALLTFLTGDAMLCYALAAASSNGNATMYLWGAASIMELHADLLLAIALRDGSPQIPYRLKTTMDRFWAVLLAPLGAIAVASFFATTQSSDDSADTSLFCRSSMLILSLFGLLYFGLKEAVCSHMNTQSTFHKALLLIVLKMLGLAVWTVGGSLLIFIVAADNTTTESQEKPHSMDMLGWSIGGTLSLFLGLRLFAGHPHDVVGLMWALVCWLAFVFVSVDPPITTSPLVFLSFYVVLVAILNILESWARLSETSDTAATAQAPEQQRLLTTTRNTLYASPEQ